MLAYKNRFHGHGSIRYVYANGRPVRGRLFTIKSTSNSRRHETRIAVVVSKKVAKGAVVRNRIRRRLYESFRERLDQLPANADIVCIVGSAEVATTSYEELTTALDQLLSEAGLYKSAKN